jgi:Ca2+-transporting ATPase
VIAVVATLLSVTVFWSPAREVFRFGPLHAGDLAETVGAGLVVMLLLEMAKHLARPRSPTSGKG